MSEPRKIACDTCLFWDYIAHDGETKMMGSCRRHAPLVTGGLHTEVSTVWPETKNADWCGDHAFNRETT